MAAASTMTVARSAGADGAAGTTAASRAPSRRRLPAADDIALDLITDLAGFEALADDWRALFARAGEGAQAFQAYDWLWHWAGAYLDQPDRTGVCSLAIVTARRGGELVLVWPLVRERAAGLVTVGWMGAPVAQYGDVLVEGGPDAATLIDAAWRFLVARVRPDLVRLRKVRADAAVAPFLAALGAIASERQAAPFLDLASAADFDSYEQRYSAKARKNRRRQMRRLEEHGPVRLQHASGEAAGTLAREALAMKRAWLASRGLVSRALADDRMSRFMSRVATAESHEAGCQVTVLRCGDAAAATAVAFAAKERLLVHVIVYDLALEKTGAGNLLVEAAARHAKEQGFATFDLMAPGDAYKLEWADGAVAVDDYALPVSLLGRAYARIYLGCLRGWLKAAVAHLPGRLRRLAASGAAVAIFA